MAFTPQVNPKDAVFVQRSDANTKYEQINISGSDAIIYLDEDGHIMADKISDWAAKYGIGTGGSSLSASWASQSLSSSFVPFNGDRPIKRDDPDWVGINVGGTNVVDFLENFFFPFLPATLSISSGATYETGSSQNITINGSITDNDETNYPEGYVRITKNGVGFGTPTIIANAYTISDNPLIGTGSNYSISYRAGVYADNDGSPTVISSSLKTISFIFPYLYGTSTTSGLTGASLYNATNHALYTKSTRTFSIIGTGTYIYYAFPLSYGPLSSIKDKNGYEILSAFSISTASVSSAGIAAPGIDWTLDYAVYQTLLYSDPSGNYTFTI